MRTRWSAPFGILAVGLYFLLIAVPAYALNVQLFRPTTGHVQGFQLFTSEALPKYNFAVGLEVNYAHHPFELTISGSTNRLAGVVDQFVTADALVAYGLTNWWTLSVDMPVNIYHNIAPTFIPTRDTGFGDAGDLLANMKFSVWDAGQTRSHLGLAFVPFVTAPTGDSSIFFGDKSLTGGLIAIGDAQWKANRFYMNVGPRFRKTEQILNLTVKDELLYGLGFERPLVKKWALNIILEAFGSTNFHKFATENISSPIEGIAVLQKKWLENRRLITNVGGGMGITSGYGVPNYRIFGGISYAWDFTPKPVVREEVITTNKIHFAFDKAVILPSSFPILDEIVNTLKSRPEVEHVTIEGHTDSKGSDEYNLKLSDRRAAAVREYLVGHGIPASMLSSVGKGESMPIAPNDVNGKDNPSGRAQNRRVEFHLQISEHAKVRVVPSTQTPPTYEEHK
jgi:outer membrane protein OmpA-like peptidoglycan-associated protein